MFKDIITGAWQHASLRHRRCHLPLFCHSLHHRPFLVFEVIILLYSFINCHLLLWYHTEFFVNFRLYFGIKMTGLISNIKTIWLWNCNCMNGIQINSCTEKCFLKRVFSWANWLELKLFFKREWPWNECRLL